MTTVAAIDFLKSHPTITELDFGQLKLIDPSAVLQAFLELYPGKLKKLTAGFSSGILTVLEKNLSAVANLECFVALQAPDRPEDRTLFIGFMALFAKNLSALNTENIALDISLAELECILLTNDAARMKRLRQDQGGPNNVKHIDSLLPKLTPHFSNLTSVNLRLLLPMLAPLIIASAPKLQEATFCITGSGADGGYWGMRNESVKAPKATIENSAMEAAMRANKSMKSLKLEISSPSSGSMGIVFDTIAAVGASLEQLSIRCSDSDPLKDTARRLHMCLVSLVQIKKISIYWKLSLGSWLDVFSDNCPPTLEQLSISFPTSSELFETCAKKILAQHPHVQLRGGFECGASGRIRPTRPEPINLPTLDIFSGDDFVVTPIDRSCKMPDSPATSVCVDCQLFLPEHDLESHRDVCQRRKHLCPNRFYGCSAQFDTRGELHAHRLECPFWLLDCFVCKQEFRRSKLEQHILTHQQTSDSAYLATRDVEWSRMRSSDAPLPWARDEVLCLYCKEKSLKFQEWESHIRICAAIEFAAADDSLVVAPLLEPLRRVACIHRKANTCKDAAQLYQTFRVLTDLEPFIDDDKD
jgi:hypothetical protein